MTPYNHAAVMAAITKTLEEHERKKKDAPKLNDVTVRQWDEVARKECQHLSLVHHPVTFHLMCERCGKDFGAVTSRSIVMVTK